MNYLITGGTGFIGHNLIGELLKQKKKATIYVLVRKESKKKLDALKKEWGTGAKRVVPLTGDLTRSMLGVPAKKRRELEGKIDHVFHLAAVYDLMADAESQIRVNVEGTQNVVKFASNIKAKRFHHMSSIAAAGMFPGIFREDMFEEARGLDNPYFRTKHDSESVVRSECTMPWRIYRPGIVVGHSETGVIDKIDGPYYFFKLIQKMRKMIPSWMPTLGLEGGRINIVPVDYVVDATIYIAHKAKLDGKCFHLTDPKPKRIGEVLNLFARAAHAPQMTMRIDARIFNYIPSSIASGLKMLPPVRRITNQVMKDLGLPPDMMKFVNYPTKFDNRETEKALKGSGIMVPRLDDYAWRLWDYWERHLDPELFIDRSLRGHVRDRIVVVTGASSGIGKAVSVMMARAGARVIMVARGEEKLAEALEEIRSMGGKAVSYTCDVSDLDDCDKLIDTIMADHGAIDVLVNNAGRSIRRSIALSYDRFHDFERTMQLNYFGSLRLILRALPGMTARRKGQVINISSIGVLTNSPRFSAYVASKAALDAFSRCASAEYSDTGITFTTINMPLVRTPMIGPTKAYDVAPTLSPEQAADMVVDAVINKPSRIVTGMGRMFQIWHLLAPKLAATAMNIPFRMFGDSDAAKGVKPAEHVEPSSEQVAIAALLKGVHY